ncbi:MAG: heme utilization cystosolic carrier protein HutX [Pseudomonadota bacterium]
MAFDADKIQKELAEGKGPVLEWVARDHGVPALDVFRLLPKDQRLIVEHPPMAHVLATLTGWGEVMIIAQSDSLVAEIVSAIPPATLGRGYFNFHGDTPFGGHLKEGACTHIAFVERPFAGRRSLSIVFFDQNGGSIFKVFVRRAADGELLPDQEAAFIAFRAEMFARDAAAS